jgi:hypothetical protein
MRSTRLVFKKCSWELGHSDSNLNRAVRVVCAGNAVAKNSRLDEFRSDQRALTVCSISASGMFVV